MAALNFTLEVTNDSNRLQGRPYYQEKNEMIKNQLSAAILGGRLPFAFLLCHFKKFVSTHVVSGKFPLWLR